MPSFHHGAVEIAYIDEGEGDPIVLVHGFASSKNVNWVYPSWVSDLKKSGRRVIAFDNRGHGDSSKLYDSADYELAIMASDIAALMDHLKLERADVMGYSLGSRMTAMLARSEPHRLRSAILGGIGIGLIEGGGPGENVVKALEADSLDEVTDPVGRTFRAFADQTRSDRKALAACYFSGLKINFSCITYAQDNNESITGNNINKRWRHLFGWRYSVGSRQ